MPTMEDSEEVYLDLFRVEVFRWARTRGIGGRLLAELLRRMAEEIQALIREADNDRRQ